ncbi:MAG: DUF3604 domain-containing protein [Myxococcota bacterium]
MSVRKSWGGSVRVAVVLLAVLSMGSGNCGMRARHDAPSILNEVELEAPPLAEKFHRCAEFTPSRRAFFGELHLHTTYSLDANLEGTRLTPRQAYRFALGEAVSPPGADQPIQIDRPLDFAAVTDHAEFLGFVAACGDPNSQAYRKKGCQIYRRRPDWGLLVVDAHLTQENRFHNPPRACGDAGEHCYAYREAMWIDLQNEAERAYDRSGRCRFTSFVGYEYTASPSDGTVHVGKVHNMHRIVLFRNSIVPRVPVDFFDAAHVQDLWAGLRKHCTGLSSGCDALAIPHNANLSAGRMFDETIHAGDIVRKPIDEGYAREQATFEPLMEIMQHKGSSECLPGQTAGDELCAFEVIPYDNLRAAKVDKTTKVRNVDTMRYAYEKGLQYQQSLGVNPWQFGIVGGTDGHLGLAGNVNEAMFLGGGGAGEGQLDGAEPEFPDRVFFGPGSLTGVWAEENSREAIFRALRRKETFATSGPRIQVRSYGGWKIPSAWCQQPDRIDVAYARGVPMGGTLAEPPAPHARPLFAIEAMADPGTTKYPGAKLQRLQVVKAHLDEDGKPKTEVFNVAGDPAAGVDLDVDTCTPSAGGFDRLCTVWGDDAFDPNQPAQYYVRAVEVPTCRWSTLKCVAHDYDCENPSRKIDEQCCHASAGLHPRDCRGVTCDDAHLSDPCCQPGVVRPLIQERAWTSPIWYTPSAD